MSWIEEPSEAQVGSLDLLKLNIDQAYLNFTSNVSKKLWLYTLSSACYTCPYTLASEKPFEAGSTEAWAVDTTFQNNYRFRTKQTALGVEALEDEFKFCDFGKNPTFQEFGVYNILMEEEHGIPNCTVTVAAEPVNIYLPLLLAFLAYVCLAVLLYITGKVLKRWRLRKTSLIETSADRLVNLGSSSPLETVTSKTQAPAASATLSSVSSPNTRPQRQRLRSLDAFRGICIVVMIFVNYGGGKYTFFEHAIWDGLTVADLVFPWFMWIMGVCVPISIKSQVKRGIPRTKTFKTILLRSMKLIGLGLLYNSIYGPVKFGEHANLRIPGVLQRFGVCYFVCSTLVLWSMTVNFTKPGGRASKFRAAIQDITILWSSWLLILVILLVHCLLTFFLPVPGCPTGYLGPGGLDLSLNATAVSHCIGGASGYVDLEIFTRGHIYNFPTAKAIFQSGVYDPEGFLGTLTSIVQVWLGVQTGATMLVFPRPWSRLKRWGIWAIVTGVIGTILCQAKMTGGWIPLNKNLWSISFVLVTTCFANVLLSFLYFFIDIKRWWTGSPFFEPGMNSILLYMGHSILHSCLPWRWSDGAMRTHFIRLVENLWATSLWAIVGIWLHSKKTYWSV